MIYLGIDWAEAHHDAFVMDEAGDLLAKGRVAEGVEGLEKLHEMAGAHSDDPSQVIVGIETDRGLMVQALIAAGYVVYAINPFAASRYRDRHQVAGAKSDPADAKMLADLVRTDRHNHRQVAGDSELSEAIKVLARAQQSLVWTRGRQINQLRSALREFYPAALEVFDDLGSPDALAILQIAPTPELGRALSRTKIRKALERGGRRRNLDDRSTKILEGLRTPQLRAPELISGAFGSTVRSTVAIILSLNTEIARLSEELASRFEAHPDAEIITSLPGLSFVLGARVLGEFGDDPNRYEDARARRNYAGMAPITRASGPARSCSHGWHATSDWPMRSTCGPSVPCRHHQVLGQAMTASAPPARRITRRCASLANRWVGILHGCLSHHTRYDEDIAWPSQVEAAA